MATRDVLEIRFNAVRKEVAEKMNAAAKLINDAKDIVAAAALAGEAPKPKAKYDDPDTYLPDYFYKEVAELLVSLDDAGWRTSSFSC